MLGIGKFEIHRKIQDKGREAEGRKASLGTCNWMGKGTGIAE